MDLSTSVRSIMTRDPITVSPVDNLKKVQSLFVDHKIHHLPVIDEGRVVGIVSTSDLQLFRKGRGLTYVEGQQEDFRLSHAKVKEIMSVGLAKLDPSDDVSVAIKVFEENILHAILVVEEEDRLRGIVTPLDIIHALM